MTSYSEGSACSRIEWLQQSGSAVSEKGSTIDNDVGIRLEDSLQGRGYCVAVGNYKFSFVGCVGKADTEVLQNAVIPPSGLDKERRGDVRNSKRARVAGPGALRPYVSVVLSCYQAAAQLLSTSACQ